MLKELLNHSLVYPLLTVCPKLLESRENIEGGSGEEYGLVGMDRRGEHLNCHCKESKRLEKERRETKQANECDG